MSIQFDPEWERFSLRLRAFPQELERNMRATMTASLLLIERDARRTAPQDTRRLAGSITHTIAGTGIALEGRVGPSVQYGRFVEFGRDAGRMPPPRALVGWVRRHWAPSAAAATRIGGARFAGRQRNAEWRRAAASAQRRALSRGRSRQQAQRSAENVLLSHAWALAVSIGKKGVRAQPYLGPAYNRNSAAIMGLFARMGVRVVAQLAGGGQGGTP